MLNLFLDKKVKNYLNFAKKRPYLKFTCYVPFFKDFFKTYSPVDYSLFLSSALCAYFP